MTYSRLGSGALGGNVVGLQKSKMEKTKLCYLRLDRVFTLQPLYIIIKLHARIFILSHAFIEWLDHKTLVLLHPNNIPPKSSSISQLPSRYEVFGKSSNSADVPPLFAFFFFGYTLPRDMYLTSSGVYPADLSP